MNEGLAPTVLRGMRATGVGFAVAQGLSFAAYLALARVATPTDFGVFAAGSILVAYGAMLTESGLGAAIITRRDRVEEAASTAAVATVLAGIGFSLLALSAAPLLGLFFRSSTVTDVALALSGLLVVHSLSLIPSAVMQRRFSFVRRIVAVPAQVAAFGITAGFLCAAGYGVWGLVIGTYVGRGVEVVLTWVLARWRPSLRLASVAMWRELASYGRHVLVGGLIARASDVATVALLGRVVSTAAVGQFQYAARVGAQPFTALVDIVSQVLLPAFSRISSDRERFARAVLRAMRWMAVIAFPLSLMLLPLGPSLMVLVFGEPWREAGYALSALCLFSAGRSFDSLASETWKAAQRPELIPRLHVVGTVATVLAMLALVPFGLVGVAAGFSVGALVVAVYAVVGISRVLALPMRLLLAEIWPAAIAAGVMVGILLPLEHLAVRADRRGVAIGLSSLLGEAGFGITVYLLMLSVFVPGFLRELRQAIGIVRTAWRPARQL